MKRFFDITLAMILIILFSPIFLCASLLILLLQGKPIFKQNRLGKDHLKFKIIKFSTMNRARDHKGELLPDQERTTLLGNFLRKTSIDEIPSLWNVLKGEMSIVGPRPLRARYLERYTIEQDRRHEVKPGITGWAQINGRNAISWEEKFKLDVWYVDNQSYFLDIKILVLTVFVVIFIKNVNASEDTTMEEFLGNDNS